MVGLTRNLLRRRLSAVSLLMGIAVLCPAVDAQVNEKQYQGYFLVGQFGEICTMCEAVVLCQAGETPASAQTIPAGGTFTLYHLHTRTLWSQVSTIWEWFIANFNSRLIASGHVRPVTIYSIEDGAWSPPSQGEVRVSLEPAVLAINDGHDIDRTDRRWWPATRVGPIGYCGRLPLWESLAVIGAHDTNRPSP